MRAVLQRVSRASVTVSGEQVGAIGVGLLALVAVGQRDDDVAARWMASKIAGLRIFPDDDGKMERSVRDVAGAVLVVSQFTLYGDARRGRRPSYIEAAPPARAEELVARVGDLLSDDGIEVQTGRFRAMMEVSLVNDGPVTILLDSERTF